MHMYGVVTSGRADRVKSKQLGTSKVFSSQGVTATYNYNNYIVFLMFGVVDSTY